ncbi:MAG: glucans biosynthesis glucosyltransferase MdoH [Deltaproteobacteria bacterium]|jgi:membrane glycosyltransferase|nr:glucans biosynthesis glucosyltransferase MdoH [Deltaproteobacteria bacterium]
MTKKDPWERAGTLRRLALLTLITVPTLVAADVMYSILPHRGEPVLSVVMTSLFAVLFAWISVGFWSSLTGFLVLALRRDSHRLAAPLPEAPRGEILPRDFRTAILFPVYNEDPWTVAKGARAVRQALRDLGEADKFDVFILSDSTSPDAWAAEEEAFLAALREDTRRESAGPAEGGRGGEALDGAQAAHGREAPAGAGSLKVAEAAQAAEGREGPAAAQAAEEGKDGGAVAEEGAAAPGAGGGRLFYRHRRSNIKRKSGNVADFLRRWGAEYRYMIVFDADSLMSAETLARLVLSMEARPDVGIIQTPPKAIFSRTPLARVQQFANHFYGPVFAAGLHFWQLGCAQFWGHNAILRTAPFMEHCMLPRLKGASALGGEILSHDFVESALMRRAGYGVWLAYDLEGSWEMTPPTLMDELVRDRRWCQGNLQHMRLIFTRGFFPTHRALFLNGILSYGSALLWFFFLLASTAEALSAVLIPPDYFPAGPSLFPDWPRYFPAWALALLSSTGVLLFLPKAFALILAAAGGRARAFGGAARLCLSICLEIAVSTFLAPVRMLFHSFFVVTTLLGFKVSWNPQNRGGEEGLAWSSAFRTCWPGTLLGIVWGLSMYFLSPGFFMWLSPVAAGLALSAPLAVFTSRLSLGSLCRRLGLFLTPAETAPAPEITELELGLREPPPGSPARLPASEGFARLAVDPALLAFHTKIRGRGRRPGPATAEKLALAADKALAGGPGALAPAEKRLLMSYPEFLADLHRRIWRLEGPRARLWGLD